MVHTAGSPSQALRRPAFVPLKRSWPLGLLHHDKEQTNRPETVQCLQDEMKQF